jgi:hypothetical protein
VKVHGIAQVVWPQGKVDCLWPAGARMEEVLVCALQEVSDGSLGDDILEVGIYPTQSELLPCIVACLSEGIVLKAPVVAVVVQDVDSMFGCILFESKLCSKCLGWPFVKLEVEKLKAAVVVDKDGSALVVLLGKLAF